MRKLKNFIKKIWLNKFAIFGFVFVWIMPLAFVGTKIKYVQVNIAWKITVYGFIALFILYRAFKKQIQDWLLKKTGYKGLRDYLIKKDYSFKRGIGLEIIMWFKLGFATLFIYMLSKLMQNAYSNWLLILGLIAIGSMFRIIHNIVMSKKAVQNEEVVS